MKNPEPLDLLRMHRSTHGLDEQQLSRIAQHCEVIQAEDGQELQGPSEPTDALLLVISGHLSLALSLPGGDERTVIYFGRGDQIGLLGLVQDEPIPSRVVALQRSLLVRIPREPASNLMHELPLWRRNLLQALGPKLRDTFLGEKSQQRPRFVVLIHTSEKTRHLTALLSEQLTFIGESVGLMSDHEPTLSTESTQSASVFDSDGKMRTVEDFRQLLGSWTDVQRVILDSHLNTAGSLLGQLMDTCEAAYWFCTPDTASTVVRQLKSVVSESPILREKISVVHVLDDHELVAPHSPEMTDLCSNDFKLHWNGCRLVDSPVCTQKAGLDRIIHHLRGISVGLALGGGAARGMAHLGVLQVIDKAGITIDRMSGTSAGSLTGILYAAGYSADFCIESFSRDLTPGLGYRMFPYGDAFYVFFKYRFGGWDKMLRKYMSDWRLEQLALPFSSVTVDLVAAEPVIRREGDAVHALLESINLPGIARPICRDGQALVDGGVLNVVPANVLVNQGANFVVSSDVSAKISFEFAGNRPDTPTEKMHTPSGTAALIRMRTVQDRNIRAIGGAAADIVIEPDVSTVELTDFKNAAKIAKLGRKAAEEALPELRRVLHEMDPQLFPLESRDQPT
jgi:predicted acylesterase/phospholipase RssA/CRP-like cAMP-binding protein